MVIHWTVNPAPLARLVRSQYNPPTYMKTFNDKSEFITKDLRSARPSDRQFNVSIESMTKRHDIFFQHTDLTGKRVLDLGCCCAATGAWVLDRGASHYTGVELQKGLIDVASENMKLYYPSNQYTLHNNDIETFLNKCTEQYDLVVMLGVQHCLFDWYGILKKLVTISNEIIIETKHPYHGFRKLFPDASDDVLYHKWDELSLVEVATKTGANSEDGGTLLFDGVAVSIKAATDALGHLGWTTDKDITKSAMHTMPELYSLDEPSGRPRYVLRAIPGKRTVWDITDVYRRS